MTNGRQQGEKSKVDFSWATELADGGALVVHLPSRTIGRVRRFYDGVYEHAVSSANGRPVTGPVLELEDGSTFLAVEGAFAPLTDAEFGCYLRAQREVGALVRRLAEGFAGDGHPRSTSLLAIGVALRQTAKVVDVVQAQPPAVAAARPAEGGGS